MKFMIEQIIPEENAQDETDHRLYMRRLTEQLNEATDGRVHPSRIQTDY